MTIVQKQPAAKASHSIAQAVLGCLLLLMAASGLCGQGEESTVLYIDETGLPFRDLLEKISINTGYQIELVGEWPDNAINVKMQGVSLEDGLKRIIKELGSISHALVFDNSTKKIRIVRFQEGLDPDISGTYESLPTPEGADTGAETANQQVEDEAVSPPSPDGEPGLTRSQLAAIKDEHRAQLLSQTGDTEISPSSEYGPGLTIDELEDIKRTFDITLQDQDENTFVSPPSDLGRGMTALELSRIKALHEKRSKSQGPESIVSPSSENGPGLTLGELNTIKQQHEERPLSDATLVAPPSEYGPGLTVGEVKTIKAGTYGNRQNLQREDEGK